MLTVAPVFSSSRPIMMPRTMITPIDFMVPPKPSLMAGITSAVGSAAIPSNSETINIDKKILHLNLDVSKTIRTMLDRTNRRTMNGLMLPP